MKNANNWKFWAIQYLADPALHTIFHSCRWEITGLNEFLFSCQNKRVILSTWHENLLIMPFWIRRFMSHIPLSAVVSKSRDGQMLYNLGSKYPNLDFIRVAHDSKHTTLKQMLTSLEQNRTILITPDGPQGPWKKVKHGVVQAAIWSKAEVWALSWLDSPKGYIRSFRLPTPDRMKFPCPFQKIQVHLQCLGTLDNKHVADSYLENLEKHLG